MATSTTSLEAMTVDAIVADLFRVCDVALWMGMDMWAGATVACEHGTFAGKSYHTDEPMREALADAAQRFGEAHR